MKYIVTIDWKTQFKDGFTYITLDAKNIKDAQIEAPAVAAKLGIEEIHCLRILKQTASQAKKLEATDCELIYFPNSHKWQSDCPLCKIWYLS